MHRPTDLEPPSVAAALFAPLGRLAELPVWGQVAAAVAAGAGAARHDLFTLLLLIAVGATWYDYHLGRWVALNVLEQYDELRARVGQVSKISGFVLVLIVRLLEAALGQGAAASTGGMIAVALLV
ncbi:MAG TPA: hypothetical protein VFX29_00810, partial [Longimicrobiaceae bacterium]|nr:hypothetical protein [Longimicrobiaceae bacterium]